MDLLKKKSGHYITRTFRNGIMILFLLVLVTGLSGQKSTLLIQQPIEEKIEPQPATLSDSSVPTIRFFQKNGFVKGRVTQFITNTPISYADISCSDKSSFAKSNSRGEFVLNSPGFPATLRIRKLGFKEETVTINSPNDSVLISLSPIEILKSNSGNKKSLQYELLFKKAIDKLRVNNNSELPHNSQRQLVYCRINSTVDSRVNSFFESYSHMNVSSYSIQEYQPDISRYASTNEYIPGLSENRLEFKIDPFINLPMFIEQYIKRRGFFVQDDHKIAMVRVDLGETKNVYYVNVADTSIVHITSLFKSERKNRMQGPVPTWQDDRSSSTEISFSRGLENRDIYIIDCISKNEEFRLIQKNKPDQNISKSTLFAVVPDPSLISNTVKDNVLHETLSEVKQQINFNAKYSLSENSSGFASETEKLFMKPYRHDFWAENSYVAPDSKEQKQIRKWEDDNWFYSENRLAPAKEVTNIDSLVKLMNKNLVAVENVYIETDRPDYLAGDTIWFSAYVLDNLHMDSTSFSKILYVDLFNTDNKLEKQLKLFIEDGRTKGDFTLNKDSKNGIYRLLAYTQYMRNYQNEYLFEKKIQVHQSNFNKFIIVNPVINKSSAGDSIDLYIHTILPDEYQTQEKKLEVLVRLNDTLSVRKTFSFKKYLNNHMGFFVPASLSCSFADIRLLLSDKSVISEQRLSIPLKAGINLQFFPESGKMVDDINTVIACKAVDNKGYPTEFNADIIDENNNIIRHISADNSGVSKFEFTPEYIHTYKALVNLSGTKYSFNLPNTEPKGFVMNFNTDSSDIQIKTNQTNFNNRYYLLMCVRGAVYASFEIRLDNKPLKIHLPLKMYPKGIVQITLFDSLFRPLAERLVFNNRSDQKMIIHIESDKKIYRQREKVNLTISVTDVFGNPVESSLSMAVTDASKSDSSMNSADIESYLYFTSELKGEVDFELLNLSDTTYAGNTKRDLVMMTQGWRNYLWNSIRYTSSLKVIYPIERGFCIDGTLLNSSNRRSRGGYKLSYIDFKSGFNGVSKVDENNRLRLESPLHYNSSVYFLQSRNNKDGIENLGFTVDTFPLPVIGYRSNELPFVPKKAGYLEALGKKFSEIESKSPPDTKYFTLPEVRVTAKADRSGYSTPDIAIDLDKKDPTGKKYLSLFQLIYQEFGEKAFTANGFDTKGKVYNPILVVNGSPLTATNCPPCHDFTAYSWAASIPVREVSDIKFYEAGSSYSQWLSPLPATSKTKNEVRGPTNFITVLAPDPKIYLPVVSIKTYSNTYRGYPKGAIIFSFQGIYQAREFYQPDYEKNSSKTPDNRTTIYWNPEVKTDSTGKARVSFFNSDMQGKAMIKVSGVSFPLKDASTSISDYLSK